LPARLRTTSRRPGSMLSGLFGEEAAGFCLHDGDQIDAFNEILVFRILCRRQGSVIRFPA
jgi:hypothetical protein